MRMASQNTDRALQLYFQSPKLVGLDRVSVETMTELLQQERLGVSCESDVWEGVLRWIRSVGTLFWLLHTRP